VRSGLDDAQTSRKRGESDQSQPKAVSAK